MKLTHQEIAIKYSHETVEVETCLHCVPEQPDDAVMALHCDIPHLHEVRVNDVIIPQNAVNEPQHYYTVPPADSE